MDFKTSKCSTKTDARWVLSHLSNPTFREKVVVVKSASANDLKRNFIYLQTNNPNFSLLSWKVHISERYIHSQNPKFCVFCLGTGREK